MATLNKFDRIASLIKEQQELTPNFKTKHEGEDKSFKTNPAEHLVLKKQFEYADGGWRPITIAQLLDTRLSYFLDEGVRIMLEFNYLEDKYYVCCTKEDYESLKLKYPKAVVIHVLDLIKLWTGHFAVDQDDNYLFRIMPTMLTVQKIFPGAQVVDVI